MPLIVLCGRPCVGKTAFARRFHDIIKLHLLDLYGESDISPSETNSKVPKIYLVNEELQGIDKSTGFNTAAIEKMSRGAMKAAVERLLIGPAIVILDSLNYIKGFRYELFCIAREAGTTMTTIWVGPNCTLQQAHALNGKRGDESISGSAPFQCNPYPENILNEMWLRFEAPDDRNKWEYPLFLVDGLVEEVKRQVSLGDDFTHYYTPKFRKFIMDVLSDPSPFLSDEVRSMPETLQGPYMTSKFEQGEIYTATQLVNIHANDVGGSIVSSEKKHTLAVPQRQMDAAALDDVADMRDFDNFDDGVDLDFAEDIIDESEAPVGSGFSEAEEKKTVVVPENEVVAPRVSAFSRGTLSNNSNNDKKPSPFSRSVDPAKKSAFSSSKPASSAFNRIAASSAVSSTAPTRGVSANVRSIKDAPSLINITSLSISSAAPSKPKTRLSWDDTDSALQCVFKGRQLRPNLGTTSRPTYSSGFVQLVGSAVGAVLADLQDLLRSGNVLSTTPIPGSSVELVLPPHISVADVNAVITPHFLSQSRLAFDKFITSSTVLTGGPDAVMAAAKIKSKNKSGIHNSEKAKLMRKQTEDMISFVRNPLLAYEGLDEMGNDKMKSLFVSFLNKQLEVA